MTNLKTANLNKWLFNPFIYIAGEQALFIGWIAMLLASGIAGFSKTHFDGALDVHFGAHAPFVTSLIEQCVAWLSVTVVLYLLALIFSKSRIRFIDVAGTIALARAVTLIFAVLGFLPIWDLNKPVWLILGAFLLLLPIIWMIALMYNAFSVSANIRGSKGVICFIIGLLAAEVLSKVCLHYLMPYL